jgi:hypothetical protein
VNPQPAGAPPPVATLQPTPAALLVSTQQTVVAPQSATIQPQATPRPYTRSTAALASPSGVASVTPRSRQSERSQVEQSPGFELEGHMFTGKSTTPQSFLPNFCFLVSRASLQWRQIHMPGAVFCQQMLCMNSVYRVVSN